MFFVPCGNLHVESEAQAIGYTQRADSDGYLQAVRTPLQTHDCGSRRVPDTESIVRTDYSAGLVGLLTATAVTRHGEGLSVIGAALFDHFLTPGNGVLSVGVRPVREVLNGGRCRCGICPTMRPPYVRD